jgi:beta-glucosidase
VEGNNHNNTWSAWEAQPGRILHGHRSGLACDWWGGRWREDFDRAAEGGQNAQRISLEWSRIQPVPDRWDEEALERYRAMLRGLRDRNMTALVTLHHFSDPLWVAERGGWENGDIPELYARYVEKAVEALKEYCTLWITINEPNVFTFNGWLMGLFPPGKKDLSAVFQVHTNLLKAHARAYQTIKHIQPQARVGVAHHYRAERPAGPLTFLDRIPAGLIHQAFNGAFANALYDGKLRLLTMRASIPEVKGTQDFFGLQYYTCERVRFNLLRPGDLFSDRFYAPHALLSESGFLAHVPDGMREALKWARGFGLPIIISENGVDDSQDTLRPRYLVEHLHQVWRAVNYNYQVKGYFHWTLVDNFEWERGWTQRFGLWGLNTETQARQRRPSVDLYAEICKNNAISRDVVARYAPDSLPVLFPV